MKKTTLLLARTTLVCNRNVASRARLWAVLCFVSLLTTAPHPARAAVTEAWVYRYNNVVSNGYGYANAVAVDGSGNVVVTGYSWGNGNGEGYYTAKYAANGALLWEKSYHGPVANSDDQAKAMALDGGGNVVVTGYSVSGTNGYTDYYTAKYAAADGAQLWEKRYHGAGNYHDQAHAVAVDGSGNVVVTGSSAAGAGSFYGSVDYYTAKYAAADGALLWEKRFNGPANDDDSAQAVAVDGSGNVVVTGYSFTCTPPVGCFADYYTAKYAAVDGALLWEKRYRGPGSIRNEAQAVAVDTSGNAVVTGYSSNGTNDDYYTAKYAAADGALLWEQRYNGPANKDDLAQTVAVDSSGNVVVTGVSDARFGGYFEYEGDYYTAKYRATDGALLWEEHYNGPANGFDYAYAVAVDGSGNVLVTGVTDSSFLGDGGDYYTAKYAAADGALLWEKRYNGPANGWDSASSLALGPNGMVAITGSSIGPSGNSEYATVVYWENLPPVSVALVPAGIRLRFTGVPGRSYNIERAPAVTGPWSTLATPTVPPGGLIEYVDTNAPVGTAFYRTSAP